MAEIVSGGTLGRLSHLVDQGEEPVRAGAHGLIFASVLASVTSATSVS
jgi:hypothetical protein